MSYAARRAALLRSLREILREETISRVGAAQARREVDAALLAFLNSEFTDDDVRAFIEDVEVARAIEAISRWYA